MCDIEAETGVQNVLFRFAVDIPHGSHREAEVQVVQIAWESEQRCPRSGCRCLDFVVGHPCFPDIFSQQGMTPVKR